MNRERESSFNPRMHYDLQAKNIYKMNNKELEVENKNLENELKKNKIKGFKIAINKAKQETSPSPKNPTKTKSKLNNSNGKIKIIENYTTTTHQTNMDKKELLFDSQKEHSIINTNISPRTNHSNNTNRSNSFLSFNNESSINKSNNMNQIQTFTKENDLQLRKSNSNNKMTSFKNKLQTKQTLGQGEKLYSTPDFDIKTNKVTKNLISIPLNIEAGNNFAKHNQNYKTEKKFELNVNNSKESISENYLNSHSHTLEHNHTHVKTLIDKLKLCQKVNLPTEKNYFISDKNLKLIKDALNEKDHDIDNLKSLLNLTKDDIDAYQKRYDDLCGIVKELSDEKNIILSNLEKLFIENKQLKENYDDFAFQYNKILIYFKTIDKFIHLAVKWFDSFCDVMKCQNQSESDNISISPNSRFLEFFRQIDKFINEENFRSFNFLFTQSVLKKAPNTFKNVHSNSNIFYDTIIESTFSNSQNFLFSDVDVDYFRMEKMNRQLKNKIYDYESFIKKLTHIYETKNVDLTEVAKDMINTKNRIAELNSINDNLEKENEYLRISYHNLITERIQEEPSLGYYKDDVNFDVNSTLKTKINMNNYMNFHDNQNNKNKEKNIQISTLQEEFHKIKSNYEKLQKENLELQDLLEIINQKNTEMKSEIESLNEELNKVKEENDFNKMEAKRILSTSISTDKYNEKINQLNIHISNLNETIKEKDNIISEMRMRLMEIERNNSVINQNNNTFSSKIYKEKSYKDKESKCEDSETDTNYKNNYTISDKKTKKSENKSWNEYLNQSDSNIIRVNNKSNIDESCLMCKDLNRKILKYQLELECLKNIKNNKDNLNMNVDLNEFMKSNKKVNLNQNNNNVLNLDLLMVCYNQAKIIENLGVN